MKLSEFISGLLEYPKIEFDNKFEALLWLMSSKGQTSAYAIQSYYTNYSKKDLGNIEDPKSTDTIAAYKNIHRRIKMLYATGLIEEMVQTGRVAHGRIDYKLTDKGLIYLYSEGVRFVYTRYYEESQLFHLFVYPLFEEKTIKNHTLTLLFYISDYIFEISNAIRYWLEPETFEKHGYDRNKPFSSQIKNIEDTVPFKALNFQLSSITRSFPFRLCPIKEDLYVSVDVSLTPKQLEDDKVATMRLLANDNRFIHVLKNAEADYKMGYRKLKEF